MKLKTLTCARFDDYMDLETLATYKYQIDIGGGGGTTWSGTLEKLAMPGVLFHHVTPTKDYFHDLLVPYVHYIPVKDDLSDLREKYEWPRAGRHGVRRILLAFLTKRFRAAACPSMVVLALPPIASRFAWRINITYASSNPGTGRRPSIFSNQQHSHWNGKTA